MADLEYTLGIPVTPSALSTSEDGDYLYNESHVTEAINNLIELFKHGPRNQAVMTAVGNQIQEIEDVIYAMMQAFLLPTAVGDQLDILGEIVGETRQGRADADYRAAVRVRVLVNRSNGKIEELLAIARGMVPSATIYAADIQPATLHIAFSTMGTTTLRTAFTMLRQAKLGGVRILVAFGATVGAVDGSPVGGTIGAVDGNPAGFTIGGGM